MATSSPRDAGRALGTPEAPRRLRAIAARWIAAIAVLGAAGVGGATAAHADPVGEVAGTWVRNHHAHTAGRTAVPLAERDEDDPVSASAGTLQLMRAPSRGRHMAGAEAGRDKITSRARVRVAPPPSDPPADPLGGVRQETRALGVELFALISVASVALGGVILFVLDRRGGAR